MGGCAAPATREHEPERLCGFCASCYHAELALDTAAEGDAGVADAAYVPVPIYGGVFPDPVTRARV